jgi:hypothetical protein
VSELDPALVFDLIAADLPDDLHEHVLVIGSLAAAYHYRDRLRTDAVNTKDADVVVQPAGALAQCRAIASRLLGVGWRRRDGCAAQPAADDVASLSVVRLHPPGTDTYFLELLALPERDQSIGKEMLPLHLDDGWYVLPAFRHLRLVAYGQQRARHGLRYAAPEMMALSNLLAHRRIGPEHIGAPIEGRRVLRSAKDLGRVLAIARLAERAETEAWVGPWTDALRGAYDGADVAELGAHAGDGLRALLDDPGAFDDAHFAVDVGLLRGHAVTATQLRAIAEQLLVDAIEPLADATARRTR